MNEFRRLLGQRLKSYRLRKGLSQEKLAEIADCHPTYIGQLERGEKNATLESVLKLSKALGITLSELFYKLDSEPGDNGSSNKPHSDGLSTTDISPELKNTKNYPLYCYDIVLSKPVNEQAKLYQILIEIEKYKGNII